MRNRLMTIAGLIIGTAAAFGSGCFGHKSSSTGAKTVAIITPAGANDFNVDLLAGATDEARLAGWNPIVHLSPVGDSDDTELAALAMRAISQKPAALSVCGMETTALEKVVHSANAAGIPIFVHNQIKPVSGDIAAYIGYDEFEAGAKCGAFAKELLSQSDKMHIPSGQVAILDGSPGEHSDLRSGGFKAILKSCADVQIVEEMSGSWAKDKADQLVTDWIHRYPSLRLIFACSDTMALGASHALFQANLHGAGSLAQIIGFGGSHEALVKVKYGDMAATLNVEPKKIGARIIHEMMDSLAGSDTVHFGEVIHTETTLISQQNLESFLGGFDKGSPPEESKPSADGEHPN